MTAFGFWLHATKDNVASFLTDERGAVTVDFVVLTASAGIYGSAVTYDLLTEVDDYGDEIASCIENQSEIVLDQSIDFEDRMRQASASCSVFGG